MQQCLGNFDKPFEKIKEVFQTVVLDDAFPHCRKNLWICNNLNLLLVLGLPNHRII